MTGMNCFFLHLVRREAKPITEGNEHPFTTIPAFPEFPLHPFPPYLHSAFSTGRKEILSSNFN